MTVVLDAPAAGPALHALVIGVGDYPFLHGEETWKLGQLASPPVSALELARWLKTEFELPAADGQPAVTLGSIELLVSQAGGAASFDGVAVERADMAGVKKAFRRWLERCNRSEEHIALLFFSGHGVGRGGWQGLLLDGFDPLGPSKFDEVVDLDQFTLGMDQCLARRQCFLIDACRNTPPELLEEEGDYRGSPLIGVKFNSVSDVPRDVCLIRATAAHQAAYGFPGQPTLFTGALVRALRGAGCSQLTERWEVRTDSIVPSLTALLRHDARKKSLPQQIVKGPGDDSTGFVLHVPKTPRVPVVVRCEPRDDNQRAELRISRNASPVEARGPKPDDWEVELEIASDEYEVSATFADGAAPRSSKLRAFPPIREVCLAGEEGVP